MERNEIFDFYKAVLIFGVVWGHAITGFGGNSASCNITWLLRLYDMPFFMLISGYFLRFSIKKYSLKALLVNKTTTILFPAIIWGMVYLRSFIIFNSVYYFLFAVYFSSVAVILIENLCSKRNKIWIKWICYPLIIIALYLTDERLYNLCYLFPFFLLGYKNDSWNNYPLPWFLIFILGVCFWNNSYNIWNSDTNIFHGRTVLFLDIYRLVLGCAAIATVRMILDMAYAYFKKNNPLAIGLISRTIGRETLGLYISHVFVILFVKLCLRIIESKLGYNPFLLNERLLVFFITPVFSIITLFFCYKAVELCKKNKYLTLLWGFKIKRFY